MITLIKNMLHGLRLDLSSDWVCIENRVRRTETVEETDHGTRVKCWDAYIYKNMQTGETRELRKSGKFKRWEY